MQIARITGLLFLGLVAGAAMTACTGGADGGGAPGTSPAGDSSSDAGSNAPSKDPSTSPDRSGQNQPADESDLPNCDNFEPDVSTASTVGSCTTDTGEGRFFCQEWGWAGGPRDETTGIFEKTCEGGSSRWSNDPCDRSDVAFGCRSVSPGYPSGKKCYSQVATVWYSASSAPKSCPDGFEKLDP